MNPIETSDTTIEQLLVEHRLLANLTAHDRRRLVRKMTVVSLSSFQTVYEASGVIRDVFFPLTAVLFFAGMTLEGRMVEVGQIGCEGIAGVEVAMRTSFASMALNTAGIQIPGIALRMNAKDFAEEVDRNASFNRCVRHYLGFALAQLQLLIACNRHHSVEQRGARWLLTLYDRTGTSELQVTQQHLADMLGVTRQSADRLLNDLQGQHVLETRRGNVTILDRPTLLEQACECYREIAQRLNHLFTVCVLEWSTEHMDMVVVLASGS